MTEYEPMFETKHNDYLDVCLKLDRTRESRAQLREALGRICIICAFPSEDIDADFASIREIAKESVRGTL